MTDAAARELGPYRILARSGTGRASIVYQGFDTELRRPVALEFYSGTDDEARAAFVRTARRAAALGHPNICAVYRVAETVEELRLPDGATVPASTPYLVLESIEGETLADVLARGTPLPLEHVVNTGVQVARSLEEAHGRGVVHGDLRPSHVVLAADGRVKVLDFGRFGERSSPAADVQALGGMLYELASGALGHEKEDRRNDDAGSGLGRVVQASREGAVDARGLAAALAALQARYWPASVVLEPPPVAPTGAAPRRSKRRLMLLGTFVGLAVIVTLVVAGLLGRAGRGVDAPGNEAQSRALELTTEASSHLAAGAAESLDRAYRLFTEALTIDPDLVDAHLGLGAVQSARYLAGEDSAALLDEAEAHFEAALRIDPRRTAARRGLIRVEWHRGNYEDCLMQGHEVQRLGRTNDVEDLLAIAEAYVMGGLGENALEALDRVLELDPENQTAFWFRIYAAGQNASPARCIEYADEYTRSFGQDSWVSYWEGICRFQSGDLEAALEQFQLALRLSDSDAGDPTEMLTWVGRLQQRLGQHEAARVTLLEALERARRAGSRAIEAEHQALLGDRSAFLALEGELLADPDANRSPRVVGPLIRGNLVLGDADRAAEHLERALDVGFFPRHFFMDYEQPGTASTRWVAADAANEERRAVLVEKYRQ